MPDTDREERLEEIGGRWSEATDGPWVYDSYSRIAAGDAREGEEIYVVAWVPVQAGDTATKRGRKDAEAIAHAPEDIDWLLSEIDRLKAKLEGEDDGG